MGETITGEVYNPPENGDGPIDEVPVAEVVDEIEAEVVDEVRDDTEIIVESKAKNEELPKKSYASIVSAKKILLCIYYTFSCCHLYW